MALAQPDPPAEALPQEDDPAEALRQLDAAAALINRWMPSTKCKHSILHRLTLFAADWRWKLGRRSCRDCASEFHLSEGEAAWCREQQFDLPTRCKSCRAQRRRARKKGPVPL